VQFLLCAGLPQLGVVPSSSMVAWLQASNPTSVVSTGTNSSSSVSVVNSAEEPSQVILPGAPRVPLSALPMCDGMLPLPRKLKKKITDLLFVEMSELLPEVWMPEEEEMLPSNVLTLPKKKPGIVTDIMLWAQCFASYVSVLAASYPSATPDLLSYMSTIIKCARDYDRGAWAQYDRNFRKSMCQRRDLRWSFVNPSMFSLCFNSRNKRPTACSHCLSDSHLSENCPERGQFQWNWPEPQSGFQARGSIRDRKPLGPQSSNSKLCFAFNSRDGDKCTYRQCKFAHQCSECGNAHPRASCSSGQGGTKKFRHS